MDEYSLATCIIQIRFQFETLKYLKILIKNNTFKLNYRITSNCKGEYLVFARQSYLDTGD